LTFKKVRNAACELDDVHAANNFSFGVGENLAEQRFANA
jgi:hypothetical protein